MSKKKMETNFVIFPCHGLMRHCQASRACSLLTCPTQAASNRVNRAEGTYPLHVSLHKKKNKTFGPHSAQSLARGLGQVVFSGMLIWYNVNNEIIHLDLQGRAEGHFALPPSPLTPTPLGDFPPFGLGSTPGPYPHRAHLRVLGRLFICIYKEENDPSPASKGTEKPCQVLRVHRGRRLTRWEALLPLVTVDPECSGLCSTNWKGAAFLLYILYII